VPSLFRDSPSPSSLWGSTSRWTLRGSAGGAATGRPATTHPSSSGEHWTTFKGTGSPDGFQFKNIDPSSSGEQWTTFKGTGSPDGFQLINIDPSSSSEQFATFKGTWSPDGLQMFDKKLTDLGLNKGRGWFWFFRGSSGFISKYFFRIIKNSNILYVQCWIRLAW
jgi:hypothetical protein